MFNVGSQELIIVLFVVLMLFGSKRIPEVARSFGKGVKDFRKAMTGLESELKLDLDLEDKPTRPAPKLGAPEGTAPATRNTGSAPVAAAASSGPETATAGSTDDSNDSAGDGSSKIQSGEGWKATESSRLPTQPRTPSPLPTQPQTASPLPTQPKTSGTADSDPT